MDRACCRPFWYTVFRQLEPAVTFHADLLSLVAIIMSIEHSHTSKTKKVIKMIGIFIGVAIIAELIALAWLAYSVSAYKSYWAEQAKQPGEITYLALGDSAAQGIGATSPRHGYVGVLAERIAEQTKKTVRVVNISKTGAKMSDYLREQAPRVKTIAPDVITIEIGANDIAKFNPNTYRAEFKKVLATLPDGSYVSNMPVFNSRPGSTNSGKQASTIIHEELQAYPKLHFVDLQTQTTENQSVFGFAPDLFHPNNLSYKNWADAFWLQISEQLSNQ